MKESIFRLSDKRALSYIEYGSPDGVPIFLFHGTPGSRIFGLENEPLVVEENLRIITPERPGYGLSSPMKGRSIGCFSSDIEALADYLEIQQFHVAGVSGGGPYTLACASNLSCRIFSTTLIASAAPMEMDGYFKGMFRGNKLALLMSKYAPFLLKAILKTAASYLRKKPEKVIDELRMQLCEWDVKVLDNMIIKGQYEGLVNHIREAYRQGYSAHYSDLLLVSRPWGIDYTRIKSPIFMWHGESDTLMPIHPAKKFADMLPNCKIYAIEGAGHLLLESEEIGVRIVQTIKSA